MRTVGTSTVVEEARPLNPAVPKTADPLMGGLVDTRDVDGGVAASDFTEGLGVTGQVVSANVEIVAEAAALCDDYCPPRDMTKGRPGGRPFEFP